MQGVSENQLFTLHSSKDHKIHRALAMIHQAAGVLIDELMSPRSYAREMRSSFLPAHSLDYHRLQKSQCDDQY